MAGIALPITVTARWMFTLAQTTYRDADSAISYELGALSTRPWALQITDVHITQPGRKTAEGYEDGGAMLKAWGERINDVRPQLLLVTGDLVDTGDEHEWARGRHLLASFQHVGCRILLAPGNHDLLSAYGSDAELATAIAAWSPLSSHRYNGHRMRLFLEQAAALDASLLIHNGQLLSQELGRVRGEIDAMCDLHRTAQSHWVIDEYVQQLERSATSLLGTKSSGVNWPKLIRYQSADEFREKITNEWFGFEWNRFFPLVARDAETGLTVVILNSTPDEVALLESAWGDFGREQLDRFAKLMDDHANTRLIVLTHHPCYKWHDEPAPKFNLNDIQRWAGLATAKPNSDALGAILSRAAAAGRQIFLFCGHRHGGNAMKPRYG